MKNFKKCKSYTDNIIDLTDKEVEILYRHFRGRYQPIVTCIESMIKGKPCIVAVDHLWEILTTSCDLPDQQELSLYHQISRIADGDQPNSISQTIVLDLFKSIALAYSYCGAHFQFHNQEQMCLVEYGLGQLQYVNSPKLYNLKEKLETIDD